MVYLIGAGPGDPGLISARGLKCLESADVVIYDHLIHPRLLRHAPPGAERIDVGHAAPQPLEQEAICYLLAEKAREGKTVARLKWGDPFVFDRGGAEALFLHEQGVAFDVVPGIPAAVAIPAYAGIPITYPGGGDTIVFIRGFEDDRRSRPTIDWASVARLDGTIVCYAGPDQTRHILSSLVAHGRPPEDAAALIFDGTLPTQLTLAGTLADLIERVQRAEESRPAIVVVGRVAALREHLRWFDARPLFGRRVLVTRPKDQATELVDRLEACGAEAIEAPMIRVVPPEDYAPLDAACAGVSTFDWIIFASGNAVDAFLERLLAGAADLRALGGVKLCGVGAATAEHLARRGLKVDLVPAEYRAEALVQAFAAQGDVRGMKVLLPRADIGREIVADELRKRGVEVTDVVAYRTVVAEPEREGEPDIYRMLLERKIDVVTFTSASAVRNFVRVIGADAAADLLRDVVVASIGPVTAEAAAQHNIKTSVMPAQYTVPALVGAIAGYFETQDKAAV